jgi:hypothetical protein
LLCEWVLCGLSMIFQLMEWFLVRACMES